MSTIFDHSHGLTNNSNNFQKIGVFVHFKYAHAHGYVLTCFFFFFLECNSYQHHTSFYRRASFEQLNARLNDSLHEHIRYVCNRAHHTRHVQIHQVTKQTIKMVHRRETFRGRCALCNIVNRKNVDAFEMWKKAFENFSLHN